MSIPNTTPLMTNEAEIPEEHGLVRWFAAIVCLAFVSLSTGSVNLFPSLIDDFQNVLGFSYSLATVMLTGGTTIMYISLPAGLFMDKFGDALTFIISIAIIAVSYLVLFFIPSNNAVFMIFYWIMAFGCSSLFLACLQVALSRNDKVKGISTSIVSSSLSLAFGLLYKVYGLGPSIFKNEEPLVSGIKVISLTVLIIVVVLGSIAFFLFRVYKAPPQPEIASTYSKKTVLMDGKLYLLLLTMLLTVFDGMLVVAAGSYVWKIFDPTYTEATSTWSFYFSLLNCIFTIVLSALLGYVMNRFDLKRPKAFSFFWIAFCIFPLAIGITLNTTHSRVFFGILMSCMGIPFGFGLTHVPAMTSDLFGNDQYGFAFGIVQFGSIISALTTMPLMQQMGRTGTTVIFILVAFAHIAISAIWFLLKQRRDETEDSQKIQPLIA